jgi:hypothetical protein
MKTAIALMAGALTLGAASVASAADNCQFFAEDHQEGAVATYNLPAVAESSGTSWYAASSIRRSKNSLPDDGPVYNNAESVRIVAHDSDVHLYTFTGDYFDGDVNVRRCEKGHTCAWTFGWMANKAHSFICQREHEVGQMLLPTASIGDNMAKTLDGKLEDSKKIEDSATRYGRMKWSTGLSRCEGFDICGPDDVVLPYHDELMFSFKSEIDPEWVVREYNVWIDFWLRPRVHGTDHPFLISESAWHYQVESGPHADKIGDGLKAQIVKIFPTLGETVTEGVWDAVKKAVNGNMALANIFMKNNERIVFTYTCEGSHLDEVFVKNLGTSISDEQRNDPCDSRISSALLSPHIQLVKNVP